LIELIQGVEMLVRNPHKYTEEDIAFEANAVLHPF